jgi:hypothetical protein
MDGTQRNSIVRRDRSTCLACGKWTRGQVHHILRRGQGGSDSARNLVTLCGRCHMLVSPIPVTQLLAYFGIDEEELLTRKARVEVAIHTWVLDSLPAPTPPPTRMQAILRSLARIVRHRSGTPQRQDEACTEPHLSPVRRKVATPRTCPPARPEPRPPVSRPPRAASLDVPWWKKERPRAGRVWLPEEDAALLRDYDGGVHLEEIAIRLGRGAFGVEVRLCKLGRLAPSSSATARKDAD